MTFDKQATGSVMDEAVEAPSSNAFKEKIQSLSFMGKKTASKTTVDHTDTAIVTTTEKNDSQDVNVAIKDHVRPHKPEMTRKYWEDQRNG